MILKMQMPILYPYLFPVLGYLSGSLPFALWVTRLVKGVDVRDGGSGHVTTTNTIRQAGLAVLGLCWPVLAQFRGGMGLATTGGCLLAISPLGFVIGLGVLVSLTLLLRHSARAAFFTGLLIPVALWLLTLRGQIIWVSIATGVVTSIRFLDDWNREYRELWLDREN